MVVHGVKFSNLLPVTHDVSREVIPHTMTLYVCSKFPDGLQTDAAGQCWMSRSFEMSVDTSATKLQYWACVWHVGVKCGQCVFDIFEAINEPIQAQRMIAEGKTQQASLSVECDLAIQHSQRRPSNLHRVLARPHWLRSDCPGRGIQVGNQVYSGC